MPGSLDSCINNIYEAGNIPASPGIPPVRVVLPARLGAAVSEVAFAASIQDGALVDAIPPRSAMLFGVFVNSNAPREAYLVGAMVNL